MTDRVPRSLTWLLLAILGACAQAPVSPQLDRSSVRLFGSGLGMDVKLGQDQDSGPFPALDLTYANMVALDGTRSTEIEFGVRRLSLDSSSDFEGAANGYLVATRWTFHRDRRLQPVGILGATWTRWNFTDRSDDPDFKGPGVFAGGGWQYQLSPRWALGLEGRIHLRYWNGHKYHDWSTSADLGLSLAFRF